MIYAMKVCNTLKMKKWYGGLLIASLFLLLILRYGMTDTFGRSSILNIISPNATAHLLWLHDDSTESVNFPQNDSQVLSAEKLMSSLFMWRKFSVGEAESLKTWNFLSYLVSHAQALPHAMEALREAGTAWNSLMITVDERKMLANGSMGHNTTEKQCPYSLREMNISKPQNDIYKLIFPCGLVQGSSVTLIGVPDGLLGNFRIELTATSLPGEPDPPIILHYNVRLLGDKVTEDPVIVQNTWTVAQDWGSEDRCPSKDNKNGEKVDELSYCNLLSGKQDELPLSRGMRNSHLSLKSSDSEHHFPFKQGGLFVATLRVGTEGIHMTVDGKHVTAFAYRDRLEPWLASEVRISGDVKPVSILANGLPSSEDIEHVVDLDVLKSAPLPSHQPLDLFIGVFSTANNFKRRMAVRRTWMQYDLVRSGAVAVRFFVGLHKNQMVNEELWREAQTYGDVQLMPFVDYYNIITWKTIAICTYGIQVVSAKYVMKTDDDAFVRIDEVLSSLRKTNLSLGMLYGLINSDSKPHRDPESKWFISPDEYPEDTYPPWAHGPGYVVTRDIARSIYEKHKKGHLKMFKLEDVAMGIWIADMKKRGLDVKYIRDDRVHNGGCQDGYVVAHYQGPRELLCLWKKIQEGQAGKCCGDAR